MGEGRVLLTACRHNIVSSHETCVYVCVGLYVHAYRHMCMRLCGVCTLYMYEHVPPPHCH